jgi:aryl-alcohol dehydrogenase-like predicted oxidoreductase
VILGASNLEVTPIAYGTWQFGGDWGAVEESTAIAAIQHARSRGVNFFDTVQAYGFGRSERLVGQALATDPRTERESVVLATKGCWGGSCRQPQTNAESVVTAVSWCGG